MDPRNPLTRRGFLASTSCLGAALAFRRYLPMATLTESMAQDPRVSGQPILDKGFAATRKIGRGVYATISDFSKGLQTLSNGGFIVGSEGR